MKDIKILEEIGLTPGEIKTYLALLKVGLTSTGPLEKEAKVSRSKLYLILDKLEKKGLASHVIKNKTTYFQAAEPYKIKEYIEEKKEKLSNIKKEFEEFLPQLEEYKFSKPKSMVSIYQGIKGIMTAHDRCYLKLKKGEEFLYLGIPKEQPETHHRYWKKDHQKRVNLKIKTRLLFNKDAYKEDLDNRNSFWGCDARYMPTEIKTPAYFFIYKDTVVIFVGIKEEISIEIVNQQIANSFKAYFDEFWKMTKPLSFKKNKTK